MLLAAHQGRHILGRIVSLQVSGQVGNYGVCGRVGFVKPVAGKIFHKVKDFRGGLCGYPVFHGPFDELVTVFLHYLRFFLPHGLP